MNLLHSRLPQSSLQCTEMGIIPSVSQFLANIHASSHFVIRISIYLKSIRTSEYALFEIKKFRFCFLCEIFCFKNNLLYGSFQIPCMFSPLHSITNEEQYEKVCNQSVTMENSDDSCYKCSWEAIMLPQINTLG